MCILSMAAFELQNRVGIVTTEAAWPTKPNIHTEAPYRRGLPPPGLENPLGSLLVLVFADFVFS